MKSRVVDHICQSFTYAVFPFLLPTFFGNGRKTSYERAFQNAYGHSYEVDNIDVAKHKLSLLSG